MKVIIRDIEQKNYQTDFFKIANEIKKKIIYTHLADAEAYVCFSSNKSLYVDVSISANIELGANDIQNQDMHNLENTILNVAKDLGSISSISKELGDEDQKENDNLSKINKKLILINFFEGIVILGCCAFQYVIIKAFLKSHSK